ncbi:MAG: methyl-accepting chemotaxis protein [Oligoflexales bacterium]
MAAVNGQEQKLVSMNLEEVQKLEFGFYRLFTENIPLVVGLSAFMILIFLCRKYISRILSRKSLKFNLMVLVVGTIITSSIVGVITELYMKKLGVKIEEIVKEDIALTKAISQVEVAQMHQSTWFERAMLFSLKKSGEKLYHAEEKVVYYAKKVELALDRAFKIAHHGVEVAAYPKSLEKFQEVEKSIQAIKNEHYEFDSHISQLFERLNQGQEPTLNEIEVLEGEEDHLNHVVESLLLDIEDFTLMAGVEAFHLEKKSEFLVLVLNVFGVIVLILNSSIILSVISHKLRKVEKALSINYTQLNHIASEVSGRSRNLVNVAQNQVSALNQTASAIQEVESTVQSNASQAQKSTSVSEEVRLTAQNSDAAMQELLKTIEDIARGNDEIEQLADVIGQIGDKTKVIDDIVFQTKLLSFNASVEAERAGEHGRGFAVVAQEVNSLAQMSGVAALEISNIVGGSLKLAEQVRKNTAEKVSNGQQRASRTSALFSDVLGSAEILLQQSKDISISTEEQSRGITEVNHAVSSIQKDVGVGSEQANGLDVMCKSLEQEMVSIGDTISDIQNLLNS